MNASRKLQLGLIVAGGALLLVVTAQRIATLRVAAEQLAFEHATATLRAALTATTIRALVSDDHDTLNALEGGNPAALLVQAKGGDAGAPADDFVPTPGSWHYDTRAGWLIYTPRFPEGFLNGAGRLRLRVDYTDQDLDGRFEAEHDVLRSVTLEVIDGVRRD